VVQQRVFVVLEVPHVLCPEQLDSRLPL